jgi:hypothetical protein
MANSDRSLLLAPREGPARTLDAVAWARDMAPVAWPSWDFNTAEGRGVLAQYHTALLHGLRAEAK